MKKRGTHVGIVLSFVIFMTFIFFVYLIIQPALKSERKDNSLEFLAMDLAKMASTNLTMASVGIIQQNPQSCLRLSDFFSASGVGNRLVVRDDSGNVLQSYIDVNDLIVVASGTHFFKVYESSEFSTVATGSPNPCQQLAQGNGYALGLIKTDEDIFQTKIGGIIANYSSNYSGLKSELKIPQEKDFDFSFTYSNGTQVSANTQNQTLSNNINIYAKNVPVVYISEKAFEESGSLNVKLWG